MDRRLSNAEVTHRDWRLVRECRGGILNGQNRRPHMIIRRIFAISILAVVIAVHVFAVWISVAPDPTPEAKAKRRCRNCNGASGFQRIDSRSGPEDCVRRTPDESGGGTELNTIAGTARI